MNIFRAKIKFLILPIIWLLAIFIFGNLALAQVDAGLGYMEDSGLGTTDIRVTIANIIRIILGFLGTLAVVVILIGGFKWMTAGGNEDKISQAKRLLFNGAIGLVIILLSFGIASFVISKLMGATGITPGGPGGQGGPGGGGPFYSNNLVVKSIAPQGPIPIRNVKVRVTFNHDIVASSAENKIEIKRADNNDKVEGDFNIRSRTVEFIPDQACPEPNENLKCFDKDTEYRVEVKEGIKSTDNKELKCGGLYPDCTGYFTTGDLIDVTPPQGSITDPDNGAGVSANDLIFLQADTNDDSGISLVEFYVDGQLVDSDGPQGATPTNFLAQGWWDTADLELLSKHSISAKVFDINDHETTTSSISVIIRPEYCFNDIKDEDEEGIDCGGDYCGACDGAACGIIKDNVCTEMDPSECASVYCNPDDCKCITLPKITNIFSGDPINDPYGKYPNGSPGNYLTIVGEAFGRSSGQVVFLGLEDDDNDDKIAPLANCGSAWQNKQVVIEIPAGAAPGPIKLITNNNLEDRTDDDYGPTVNNFTVNETVRPGICELSPNEGVEGTEFKIVGKGFGDDQGESELYFGEPILKNITAWSDINISSIVPNFSFDDYPVVVKVGGEYSNSVNFTISEGVGVSPRIDYIDPAKGAHGQYITIFGERFGRTEGTVNFIKEGEENLASTDFPEPCEGKWWGNENIIVRVPNVDVGDYQVVVTTAKNRESNKIDFSVTDDPLTPGICALIPDQGPEGAKVNIWGNGFLSGEGRVEFWQDKQAEDIFSWDRDHIFTQVPNGAQTGPLIVTNNDEKNSNRVTFKV
ncbi:MAG: hypothetical protein DRI44_06940, partial [Chlamydiae bacterium]